MAEGKRVVVTGIEEVSDEEGELTLGVTSEEREDIDMMEKEEFPVSRGSTRKVLLETPSQDLRVIIDQKKAQGLKPDKRGYPEVKKYKVDATATAKPGFFKKIPGRPVRVKEGILPKADPRPSAPSSLANNAQMAQFSSTQHHGFGPQIFFPPTPASVSGGIHYHLHVNQMPTTDAIYPPPMFAPNPLVPPHSNFFNRFPGPRF